MHIVIKIAKYTKKLKTSLVKSHWITPLQNFGQPVLYYRNKAWTVRKQGTDKITNREMKIMGRTVGYTKWDYMQNYQRKCKKHMKRINTGRFREQIMQHQPRGQISI